MPFIMIFQQDNAPFNLPLVAEKLQEAFGVSSSMFVDGKKSPITATVADEDGTQSGHLHLDLPDLDPEDGAPIVSYESIARLDRDEVMQQIVEEILDQDETLRPRLDKNKRDVMVTFDDNSASFEAASLVAFVVAAETSSGLLIPDFTEDGETVWFDNADDFLDALYGDEDDEEEGDGEEGEDDEDDK